MFTAEMLLALLPLAVGMICLQAILLVYVWMLDRRTQKCKQCTPPNAKPKKKRFTRFFREWMVDFVILALFLIIAYAATHPTETSPLQRVSLIETWEHKPLDWSWARYTLIIGSLLFAAIWFYIELTYPDEPVKL